MLEPRKSGALQKIADACAAGADPDGICPECSTANGPVREGATLLTHSVHECASKAVQKLLECGANPNLTDNNGWTPWMASTLVDESKREAIQGTLSRFGAEKRGDHIGQLAHAILDGGVDRATNLIESAEDLKVLSTYRVDLIGHQIRNHNAEMLELLLQQDMTPTTTNLINAIRARSFASVDLLLRFGMAPEQPEEQETPLMTAATMGELKIVQRLVEAGADVNRSADSKGEWTASFYARNAGKTEVGEWLASQMNANLLANQAQAREARDPKFRILYDHATSGEGLSTDEIVGTLKRWDKEFGVIVTEASSDTLRLRFLSLPKDIDALYNELTLFCPDVSEGSEAFRKELTRTKTLFLWWD